MKGGTLPAEPRRPARLAFEDGIVVDAEAPPDAFRVQVGSGRFALFFDRAGEDRGLPLFRERP